MKADISSAPSGGIFNGAFDPVWAARMRVRRFKSVVFKALQDVETNRAKLTLCAVLFLDGAILWPVLFSLKVDGHTSAPWVIIWTPLWVWDAIGLMFLAALVTWGNLKPPEGMENDWEDPFPSHRRVLEFILWVLLLIFQVFLMLRLDGNIGWAWSIVMSPLMAWACIRLIRRLHTLHRVLPDLGVEKYVYGAPLIVEDCLVLAQLVLVLLKVENQVTWNWSWIMMPVWVGLATQLSRCFWSEFATWLLPPLDEEQGGVERAEQTAAILLVQRKSLQSIGDLLLPLITAVLIVKVLDGPVTSTFVIFIPIIIVATGSLLYFGSACCSGGGGSRRSQKSVESTFTEDAGVPML